MFNSIRETIKKILRGALANFAAIISVLSLMHGRGNLLDPKAL